MVSSALTFGLAAITMGCNQTESEKIENRMEEAKDDFDREYQEMKAEVREELDEIDAELKELKAEAREEKGEAKQELEREIDELEMERDRLAERWDSFQYNTKEGWQDFKAEFKHDMNALGDAIRQIGRDNK